MAEIFKSIRLGCFQPHDRRSEDGGRSVPHL